MEALQQASIRCGLRLNLLSICIVGDLTGQLWMLGCGLWLGKGSKEIQMHMELVVACPMSLDTSLIEPT